MAVVVSFTPQELMEGSIIGSAISNVVSQYSYFAGDI